MNKKIRFLFFLLGILAIGQVVWWAYLLVSQQNIIADSNPLVFEKSNQFKTMILFEGGFFIFFWGLSLFWIYRSYLAHTSLKNTRDNFLGAISHELKTPIANVQLCLETLQRTQISEEKKRDYFKKGEYALNQLDTLVDNLLALTTMNNALHLSSPQYLNLLVDTTIEKIDSNSKKIKSHIPDHLKIKINPHSFELILKSILENSIKYCQSAGPNIEISAYESSDKIFLVIKDQGIGLSPEEQSKIFEPFWRSTRVIEKALPGTGVGLTLVSELAKKYDLFLSAQSDGLDQGTTFTISWSKK